jgi:hypothetical protein
VESPSVKRRLLGESSTGEGGGGDASGLSGAELGAFRVQSIVGSGDVDPEDEDSDSEEELVGESGCRLARG